MATNDWVPVDYMLPPVYEESRQEHDICVVLIPKKGESTVEIVRAAKIEPAVDEPDHEAWEVVNSKGCGYSLAEFLPSLNPTARWFEVTHWRNPLPNNIPIAKDAIELIAQKYRENHAKKKAERNRKRVEKKEAKKKALAKLSAKEKRLLNLEE